MNPQQIKYRAWNGIEMLYTHDIEDSTFAYVIAMGIGKNTSLMPFTGKRDIQSKYIYELDIVECGDEKGIVMWDNESAAFIILWLPHNSKKKSGSDNLASTHPSPLKKVVGNIFQNEELLGDSLVYIMEMLKEK